MAYENTSVPVERSQMHLRKLLQDHGAEGFGFGEQRHNGRRTALIQFQHDAFAVKLAVPFRAVSGSTDRQHQVAEEREERRIWRVIFHVLKARMVAVEDGVETFEQAFLPHIVNPRTGRTVYDELAQHGRLELPSALPALTEST